MVLLCQVARNILTEFSLAIVCDVKINQWKYSLPGADPHRFPPFYENRSEFS